MHKGIEMKVMLPIFLMFMSGIAFGEIYYKEEMDKPIRLEAVKYVLGQPVADKIDKNAFVEILKDGETVTLLIDLLQACSQSVPMETPSEEKVNICQNFLEQVIDSHNKIIAEYELPRKTRFVYPRGDKFYSKDKQYYMAKTKPEMAGFYGIFDNTDTMVCALNCSGNWSTEALCRPQIYASNVAFACEPQNAELSAFYQDRFLVSYDSNSDGTHFNFQHAFMPGYVSVDSSLVEMLDNYRIYEIEENKISESVVDFVDCKNFINKRLTAKKYQYIPETSEIYTEYLNNIETFNQRASSASATDIAKAEKNISNNICSKLSYYYTSANAIEAKMGASNKRIEEFLAQKKHIIDISDASANYDARNVVINDYIDVFSSANAGYTMTYDDNCTETMTNESVERGGTVYLQKDTISVQCNIRNMFSHTSVPVFYEFVSYTSMSKGNNQTPSQNNIENLKNTQFIDQFINE